MAVVGTRVMLERTVFGGVAADMAADGQPSDQTNGFSHSPQSRSQGADMPFRHAICGSAAGPLEGCIFYFNTPLVALAV